MVYLLVIAVLPLVIDIEFGFVGANDFFDAETEAGD